MIITNPTNRRKFLVRVVFKGDRYGRGDCLVHEKDEPLVEFYSRKQAAYGDSVTKPVGFGPRGQFCSSYTLSTLAEHHPFRGLCLDGGCPDWNIDAEALAPVVLMARDLLDGLVPANPGSQWSAWITPEAYAAAQAKRKATP